MPIYSQSLPSDRDLKIEMYRSTFIHLLCRLLNLPSMLKAARAGIAIIHGNVAIFLGNHELYLREKLPSLRIDGMAVDHDVLEGLFFEAFR